MLNKQYTIGEFAAINKISARMLRHYDKIGLLRPGTVLENGYRSYCSEQIPAMSLIKKYQGCGFTLAEISRLLSAGEDEIVALAKEKQRLLAAQSSQQEEKQNRLLMLLGECMVPLPNDYAVSYTQQPERLLFCGAAPLCEDEIENAFEALYATFETAGIHPAGLPLLLAEPEKETAPYRVAVQVSPEIALAGFAGGTLSAGWYLSTLHYGGYEDIGAAYDNLLCHVQAQNRQPAPPFIERYFLDCTHTADPAEFITEISIKITP